MGSLSVTKWPFMAVAHRGFKAYYPENTLVSFEKAVAAGANMLEFDVRLTRDGVPVIFHDTTLSRLGGNKKHLRTLMWEELKGIQLKDHRKDVIHLGNIPSLHDVLEIYKDQVNYYIELKTSEGAPLSQKMALCKAVLETVKKHRLANHVMIVSFSPTLLEICHCLSPKGKLGLNFKRKFPGKNDLKKLHQMNTALCPMHELLNQQNISQLKKKGFRVFPWVVNKKTRMESLMNWGVDGITTDDIATLISLKGEQQS